MLCIKKPVPLLGAQRERNPLGKFRTILDIVQIFLATLRKLHWTWFKYFWPLSENSSLPLVSQAGYVPERSMREKALLPKKRIFGTNAHSKQGGIQGGGRSPTLKSKEVTLFTMVLYNSENNTSKPIPNKTFVMFELSYCSRYMAILQWRF